jgi:NADH-ubiquinone oxidoreductase chain 3
MNLVTLSTILALLIPPLVFTISIFTAIRSSINNREKLSPFECGFDPVRSARIPFSIRFFLLAVIFIVFDIEIVLLVPIPLLITKLPSNYIIIRSIIFLLILVIGLLFEWHEGSLDWNNYRFLEKIRTSNS